MQDLSKLQSPHMQLKGAASMDGGEQGEPLVNLSPLKLPVITSTQPPDTLFWGCKNSVWLERLP